MLCNIPLYLYFFNSCFRQLLLIFVIVFEFYKIKRSEVKTGLPKIANYIWRKLIKQHFINLWWWWWELIIYYFRYLLLNKYYLKLTKILNLHLWAFFMFKNNFLITCKRRMILLINIWKLKIDFSRNYKIILIQ